MDHESGATEGPLGFRVIGAFKLASAVLLVAAGFGIFRLLNKDIGEGIENFVSRLHLDPENRLVHGALSGLLGIDRKRWEAIGVGTFFYAALHLLEGTGLLLRRRWAGYLTVVITGSLLPLEIYELARRVTLIRTGVLAVNLSIVVYLVVKLWQEHRARAGRSVATPAPT